ncbi:M24 family metallopeptidase [Epibacterium ulvae]|uniref:M24 family metallopeptidase n=1 Tax=Epibacterium ulvae TaxID=1156985 RepID=UPI001BFC7BA8|nr:M24 family metallopeptidase [Epibacterium ulvae]MBT8153416.1 M24 family metallopeptidase [Epibacterium ulvae]
MAPGVAEAEWRGRQVALYATLECPTAVMVFGYGSALGAGTQSHGAMRYLTGWDSHEAMSLFIYNDKHSVLLLSSPFLETLAKTHFDDTQILPVPVTEWAAIAARTFGEIGPLATIGISEMPQAAYQSLISRFPEPQLIEGDSTLAMQRMRKSAQEIAVLERGAAICDDLFSALPACLSPNHPAHQTQLELEYRARLAGSDYCKTWLTIDRCADGPRYWSKETNQTLKEGDQVLLGIALTVEGYWAHGIRMGTIGQPSDNHRRLWSVVHDALTCGQEALQQNTPVSAPVAAMTKSLDDGLQDNDWQNSRRFRTGHSLGTSYEEPLATLPFTQDWHPNFAAKGSAPQIDIPLDSVFELHPNLFVPTVGGAALGEMFLVETTHARPLLQFPRDLMELHIS